MCAALVLASCGGDDGEPIPADNAATLERLLEQVQRQSDAAACTTLIDATIPRLEDEAGQIPDSVSSDTRETIDDGIAHLRDLAETDCTEQQQETPTTTEETTTPETTAPETTTTTTTEPDTTKPETTTDTTQPEETTPPEDTTPPDTPPDNPPGNGGTGGTPPGAGGVSPRQQGRDAGGAQR